MTNTQPQTPHFPPLSSIAQGEEHHEYGTRFWFDFPNGFRASILHNTAVEPARFECAVMDNPLRTENGWRINDKTALGDVRDYEQRMHVNFWLARVAKLLENGQEPAPEDDPHDVALGRWWDR